MKNIRLIVSYKGTEFSGWQRQDNAVTIQGEIEKAVEKVIGKEVTLYGAGRTDAGVHALAQVANFKTDHELDPGRYRDAINFYLPSRIRIMKAEPVEDDFHARKSAKSRDYYYIIGKTNSALFHDLRWERKGFLDMGKMNEISAYILGWHDFSTFCKVSSQKENNDCLIHSAHWSEDGDNYFFEIKANRFLHNMVRSLVGIMVEIGSSKESLTLNYFIDIMDSGDHTRLKNVAPARGLYLRYIEY